MYLSYYSYEKGQLHGKFYFQAVDKRINSKDLPLIHKKQLYFFYVIQIFHGDTTQFSLAASSRFSLYSKMLQLSKNK